MPDEPSKADDATPPLARRAVLPYRAILSTKAVTVRKFHDAMEAQLSANHLAAHDIDYHLANENVHNLGIPYAGLSQVELQVREQDLAAATELLSRFQANPQEVEPAEDDSGGPIPDPSGEGSLEVAAGYENPRQLFDAAAALGAARIDCYLPLLVPRGDRPGVGKRFVVRVQQDDLDAAKELLTRAEADAREDDEPRCPKCGSYRVEPASAGWAGFLGLLKGTHAPAEMECFRCRHRWSES